MARGPPRPGGAELRHAAAQPGRRVLGAPGRPPGAPGPGGVQGEPHRQNLRWSPKCLASLWEPVQTPIAASYHEFGSPRVSSEGLKSQNHCLFSPRNALWELKAPRVAGPFSRMFLGLSSSSAKQLLDSGGTTCLTLLV